MKVCYVCCEYPPAIHGGIGSVIQNTSRALVKNGHQVRVIGLYPPTQNAPEHEDDQGVQVWRLRSSNRPLSWIPERYRLFKLIREWAKNGDIDVVEVPDWEGHALGWPRLEVPIVVRLHGSITYFHAEMNAPLRRQAQWMESRSFHRADFSSSCSSYTAKRTNQLFGQHAKPTAVLYNSVALSQAPSATTTRRRNMVVYAGTLTRKKGIIQLIKAWPQVLAANSDARLHVFGKDAGTDDGYPMEAYLRSLLAGRGDGSVFFHGHVSMAELRALYQKCGMAIFPSYAEAFPMAPLEAMAEACPVICSTRSSGPEMLRHGCDGLLVDPDNEAEIAASIVQLLENESLAQRLGKAGQETVRERFWSERTVTQMVEFYSKCISNFRQNGSHN
jgi:glycosyltransferase involved in cell wall biosynthesis